MAKEFHRSERVAEQLQRVLSEIIRTELDDPRLRLVTLTDIKVSRDLSHASVFFSTMAEDDHEQVSTALGKVAGFLRAQAGRKLVIRAVPELHFKYDDSLQRGAKLRALIDDAVADDNARSTERDDEK